ncbi:helix-turn-helix domain-containing protein [Streptomyces sp. NPDC033538]|uniref:helix-turn-helix domain-containing protein n=1 Tax=Streptomyces sp. NPDC033538 TaxID=3155367 RepID=UPI0033F89C9F
MNQPTHCPFDPHTSVPLGAVAVELDEAVCEYLTRVAGSAKAHVREVIRARIVLAAADGSNNGAIARELAVTVNTVRERRGRFALHGPDGLKDVGRSRRPETYDPRCGCRSWRRPPPHPRTPAPGGDLVAPHDRRPGRRHRLRRHLAPRPW